MSGAQVTGPYPTVESTLRGGFAMADVVFVALTLAVFALLGFLVTAMERL